jgi:rubrerythrin
VSEELQRKGVSEELQFSQPEEIELLEQDSQSWPEVRAESSINDILNLALLKEKQAVSYYRLVAGRSALRAVRELFVLLASEEGRHVHWVQKMLAER